MKTLSLKTVRRPGTVTAYIPERFDVLAVKPGDLVPDCFGGMKEVVEVFARGIDLSGRHFACLRLDLGHGSTISGSLKEGEIVRSVQLTGEFSSSEIDFIEERERRSMGILAASRSPGGFFTTEVVRDAVTEVRKVGNGWVELILARGETRFVREVAWAA